jgi:hypothetical protein
LLSLWVGVSFFTTVIRAILAFGLIYGLSVLSLILFEKTGLHTDQTVGALLDIAVGQEDENSSVGLDSGNASDTVTTYGQQARFTQRELGQAPLAGQVDHGLAQGLPDAEKQAEIVRRMGWGE